MSSAHKHKGKDTQNFNMKLKIKKSENKGYYMLQTVLALRYQGCINDKDFKLKYGMLS